MVYLKSVLAGIAAVVIAMALSPFVAMLYIYLAYKPTGDEQLGWDPVSFAKTPAVWLIIALIFAAGFFWEFRQMTK